MVTYKNETMTADEFLNRIENKTIPFTDLNDLKLNIERSKYAAKEGSSYVPKIQSIVFSDKTENT